MVLRSGIIIPFQFRDAKKLLMIGVPEEKRDLSIWDLKNVVRAAFGIYNFEFRNKKIGFNIPDELLLHYLDQRHDLTNFVIEIGQVGGDADCKETKDNLSFEPSCSSTQKHMTAVTPLSSDSPEMQSADTQASIPFTVAIPLQRVKSPLNNSDHSSNQDIVLPQKIRISQAYSAHTPESMTQSIDPMDIIPKSEQEELEEREREQQHTAMQHHHQQQQQAVASHFFANYGHGQNVHVANVASPPTSAASVPPHQQQYTSAVMNRFRRRGERMSKDQKELYVKYFEENPCMLTQRRNDIMLEPHWNKLASLLNSVPQGAVKNVEEWKQTFDAWRYRVFMYTRYNSKLTGTAAQNPKNYKPLTPTDQRAYAMWTSHKHTTPQDYDKMDMFAHLDDTQTDYDY